MMKKLISLLLALCMMTSVLALLPSFATSEEPVDFNDGSWTAVSTTEDFENMSADGKYYLTQDLDFGGKEFTGAILKTENFAGIFDGCGYSLLNFSLTADGNGAGVFNKNFQGTLKNLTIGSEDAPVSVSTTDGNKSIGTVTKSIEAGETVTFKNVSVYTDMTFTGSAAISSRFAAFAGYIDNTPTEFVNCHVYGSISGQPAAGFVVTNANESPELTFRNCSNNAAISSPSIRAETTAGFFSVSWNGNGGKASLKFYDCENNGDITSGDYPSGDRNSAAGFVSYLTTFNADVYMEGCTNTGAVKAADGCAAGFIAVRKDSLKDQTSSYTVKNCVNAGNISYVNEPKNTSSAGIISIPTNAAATVTVENSANIGDITGGKNGAAGIMNVWKDAAAEINISIIGCFNAGAITANLGSQSRAGGIAGTIGYIADSSTIEILYCYNVGKVTQAGGRQAAGIAAELDGNSAKSPGTPRIVSNCYNIGEIEGGEKIAIARADWNYDKASIVALFNFFTNDLNATNGCISDSGNERVADAAEMLAKLDEVKDDDCPVQFVADVYGINGGYPVLSWQIPASTSAEGFDEGTIEETEATKYAVSTQGLSGFISARNGTNENTSDIRFVLALDTELYESYHYINVTVEFCNAFGVVKSITLTAQELSFYLSVTGAGNTYTATDGNALFGVIITGVPDSAWDYAVLSVDSSVSGVMCGITKASDLIG